HDAQLSFLWLSRALDWCTGSTNPIKDPADPIRPAPLRYNSPLPTADRANAQANPASTMAGTCAHVEFLRAQPAWALALAAVGLLVAARAALRLALWVYAAFLRPGKPLRRRYGPWAVVTGATD
uniref:Uncharacterized protein n=1 Tax=Aegilops tauschii subsp. strangulata TaxID=200361 RepID=A0A453P0F0_AEGTS